MAISGIIEGELEFKMIDHSLRKKYYSASFFENWLHFKYLKFSQRRLTGKFSHLILSCSSSYPIVLLWGPLICMISFKNKWFCRVSYNLFSSAFFWQSSHHVLHNSLRTIILLIKSSFEIAPRSTFLSTAWNQTGLWNTIYTLLQKLRS